MAQRPVVNVFTGETIWQEEAPGTPIEDPESAKVLIALIGLVLSPWLYPLLTVAAAAAAFVAGEVADVQRLAPPTSSAVVVGAAVLVFALGMRVEQRLGSFAPYRWLRHLMRLAVPALAVYRIATGDGGPAVASDLVGGTAFVVLIAQAVLWFARSMREDWHVALRAMRLRAASLDN